MPVFKHSNNAELNPMLNANKKVFKNMKRAFRSEPQNNLAQTAEAGEIYESLSSSLTKIQSLLGEIITINANSVDDAGRQWGASSSRNEHTVSIFAQLFNLTKSLDRYLNHLPNLNMLSQLQYQDVASSITAIHSYNQEIQAYDNSPGKQLGMFRIGRLFPEYLASFDNIFTRLRGYMFASETGGFSFNNPIQNPADAVNFDNDGGGGGGGSDDDDGGSDGGDDGSINRNSDSFFSVLSGDNDDDGNGDFWDRYIQNLRTPSSQGRNSLQLSPNSSGELDFDSPFRYGLNLSPIDADPIQPSPAPSTPPQTAAIPVFAFSSPTEQIKAMRDYCVQLGIPRNQIARATRNQMRTKIGNLGNAVPEAFLSDL